MNRRFVYKVRKVLHRRRLSSEFVYLDSGGSERCHRQGYVGCAQTYFDVDIKLAMKLCFDVEMLIYKLMLKGFQVWPEVCWCW